MGNIEGSSTGSGGTDGDEKGEGGEGVFAEGVIPPLPTAEASACLAGTAAPTTANAVFRRLNRTEYDNTVRDLLGDLTRPAGKFPAEERALGFDNNAAALTTSPVLIEQYVSTAEALAASAITKLQTLAPCDNPTTNARACGQKFIDGFANRAFRRPLQDSERTGLQALFDEGAKVDYVSGIRMVIEAILGAAPFLYRVEIGEGGGPNGLRKLTSWEMASRISYFITQSMPDAPLMTAAAANELQTPAQVRQHVDRLLQTTAAADMVARFADLWLKFELLPGLVKDTKMFPDFGVNTIASLQTQARKFIDEWMVKDGGRLDALMNASYTFMDAGLAKLYGTPAVTGNGFVKTTREDPRQRGVLAQPALMAMLAHANQTAPVHRGKFVREQWLCDELPPPPPGLSIAAPALDPGLTTRERFAQHSAQPACRGCHQQMDPIGLGFENFDALGKFRTQENGKPVDAHGELTDTDVDGTFDGAAELQTRLAQSSKVKQCVVRHWFRFASGRKETPLDACTLRRLADAFDRKDAGFPELIMAIAQSDAFLFRNVESL